MVHIGNNIKNEIHKQKRTVVWFADQLNCDRTNIYDIYNRASLDTELLMRISIALKVNFFKLLDNDCDKKLLK